MQILCSPFSFTAYFFIEEDIFTPLYSLIEKRSTCNRNGEHLFQTYRLGTQLNAITVIRFRLAMFKFNRVGGPFSLKPQCLQVVCSILIDEFYFKYIELALKVQALGADYQTADLTSAPAEFLVSLIDTIMLDPAACGQNILLPLAFDVDERALPRTKK